MSQPSWQADVFAALKRARIAQVGYVPDAGHAHLINAAHADPEIRTTVLTTEEEGIALAAGAWLGGQRAVLLMQSSGVGNCINMLSLPVNCRMPFLTLVTMRGEWGEFNPWQVPMGTATPSRARRHRRACPACRPRRGGRRDRRGRRRAGLRQLRAGRRAVLATPDRHQGVLNMSGRNDLTLDRRAVVATLLRRSGRSAGGHRPRRRHLRRRGRRRPGAQFLSLGCHGRHRDDRPGPGAGAAGTGACWC